MANIPKDFQDYDDDDPDIEIRRRRFDYWKTLKNLRTEYLENHRIEDATEPRLFLAWVEEKYGLRPKMFENHITDDYDIVDEKKYMIYVLKYGK